VPVKVGGTTAEEGGCDLLHLIGPVSASATRRDEVQDLIEVTAAAGGRPVEGMATFLAAKDALVVDWFERGGAELGIAVCGRATSIREAIRAVPRSDAAVAAVDQELADGSGLELVRRLRAAGVTTPLVLMTALPVPGMNDGAQRAKASGTVVRSGSPEDVAQALAAAAAGRRTWDVRHPGISLASPREIEVLGMIAAGYQTADIAERLVLSTETIKSHVQNVLLKFGAHTRAEAVAIAVRAGFV
jgi:DNA-binding NarL/FixJ family response regulator